MEINKLISYDNKVNAVLLFTATLKAEYLQYTLDTLQLQI